MLGLNCHIYKDKGEVTKVTTPNGEESLLYKEALRVLGDKDKALDVWSTAYSNGYAEYLNLSPKEINLAETDKNGEPLYRNIMAYLGDKVHVSGSYVSEQMRELNNFMMALNLSSAEDVRDIIENTFYKQNKLLINEYNLRDSGLYTEQEINRIISSPKIRKEVSDALSSLMEYLEDNIPNRSYYLAEPVGEDLIYADGYNIYGKRNIINPSDIDIALRQQVGGIKSRRDFDKAMGELSYQQVVERYISDPEYAERIYERYSELTRIPIVKIGVDGLVPAGSDTAGMLISYASSGVNSEAMLDSIESINMLDPQSWTEENIVPILKGIESDAVKMGIDIVGLPTMFDTKTQEEFDEFLNALYIFTNELNTPNVDVDFTGFAEVYDRFFDRNKENIYVTSLDENLSELDLVYMRSSLSKGELFDRYNLLAIPGYNHIYQRIEKDNIDDIYQELYDAHLGLEGGAGLLPTKAFYPTAFSGGKFDQRKLDDPNNQEDIIRDMKRYIMSTVLPNETEEMALYHIIYGHPAYEQEDVNIQREYNIFKSAKEGIDIAKTWNIRQWILNQKLNNPNLYEAGLKYIEIDSIGNISLMSDDPNVLKSVDLALDNLSIREDFKQYAFISNEPTLQNLFYINNNGNDFQNSAFRGWLYSRHPSLLTDFRGVWQRQSTGFIEADSYDDFIKVNGSIYGKVNERLTGSMYQRIANTQDGVMYPMADIGGLEYNTGMPQEETVAGGSSSSMVRVDKTIPASDPLNIRLEC